MPIAPTPSHSLVIQRAFQQNPAPVQAAAEPSTEEAQYAAPTQQQSLAAYRTGIEILLQVLDLKPGTLQAAMLKLQREEPLDVHERASVQLDALGNFVATGILGAFDKQLHDQFMTRALRDFGQFCELAQKSDLPEKARRQAILNFLAGTEVCGPAVAQHMETAARELQALTGMAPNFMHRLIGAIEEQARNYIHAHQLCMYPGNEIHYVAAFFNQVAGHFGLSERTDSFMPTLDRKVLDAGAQHVLDADPTERVTAQMAQEYLARIAEFYAANQHDVHANSLDAPTVDAMYNRFASELQPELYKLYGPVEKGIFFHVSNSSEMERYWVTSDVTLVARTIARNLRLAGVIHFKPAYVVGAPGDGLKLKQLGESLFYVSETFQAEPVDSGRPQPKNLHVHQTLDQFVLQDMQRGRQLLDQLDQDAQAVRDDFWRKMPRSLYREMKDAPGPQESAAIFQQTLSLLDSMPARHRFALQILEQARLGSQRQLQQLVFAQLNLSQLATDGANAYAVLLFALRNGHPGFARQLIKEMDPAMLGHQDESGYTLLMHALENEQPEATQLLIEKMSAQQISIQETDGNNALMGALITRQPEAAAAIISKLDAKMLNAQNAQGQTALMVALVYGEIEAAKAIIDLSGRKHLLLQNLEGETARSIALRCGETEIAQFLREKSNRILSWLYRREGR